MQVRHDEGVAIHIGPEPCVVVREGGGEASAGERIGQPSSRERKSVPGADAVVMAEGNTGGRVMRVLDRPGVVKDPGMCGRSLCGNREVSSVAVAGSDGPHREGEEPKPMMDAGEKSDSAIVARKPTNNAGQPVAEPVERRAETEGNAGQQRTRRAQDRASVSQALDRIRQAARHRRKERFTALFHHISPEMLRTAFLSLKREAAPGVDGLTWRAYAADLDHRIEDLHARVRRGAYRALPSRRRYIPKADGNQRPLAVAALEDKIVQRATAALLNAIYEEEFLGFSYGFRPGRSQHDALDALVVGISSRKVNYILDADIRSFFDAVSQTWLIRFVEHPDRRSAHRPPYPQVAEGGCPGGRGRHGQRDGNRAGVGDLAAARQRLPALRVRSLGAALATARGHGRHDRRPLCR